MKITFTKALFGLLLSICYCTSQAASFTSLTTGNWNDKTSWVENAVPTATDDVYINAGHTITISNTNAYTHSGSLVIYEGATLMADVGNSTDGFIFDGSFFYVFGTLTLTSSPEKDFEVTGNSLFWGHPSAVIYVSDDWKVSGNSETIVDGICVEVDDDFHIYGTNASVCGNGGVSIGNNGSSNTFDLKDNATLNQICLSTTVYRGEGGNCTTVVKDGTGNAQPTAYDDAANTVQDIAISIDVLDLGTADSDPSGDNLKIIAAGLNQLNNGHTIKGGIVTLNDNGTVDPGDDFVDYTPPTGFVGLDTFTYVITDQNGAYTFAEVSVEVNSALPVELVYFNGAEAGCKVNLEWATAAELNSDYFEIQKSVDGENFKSIGEVSAAGFSSQYRIYEFTDDLPEAQNYYRLRQVDFDGTETYTDLIAINANCIGDKSNLGIVTLFPNPVMSEVVNLKFRANFAEALPVTLADIYGKNIRSESIQIEQGMNNISMDIADLQAGTYVLTIGHKVSKFIKQWD